MTLNLKSAAGREIFLRLVDRRRRAARGLPARRHEAARASTTRRSRRATRASSTAPSRATARTARTATASATTSTTSASPACSSFIGAPRRRAGDSRRADRRHRRRLADGRDRHPLRGHRARADRARPDGRHLHARRRRALERLSRSCSTSSAQTPQRGRDAAHRLQRRATRSTRRATAATSPSAPTSAHFWATLCRHFGREEFIEQPVGRGRRARARCSLLPRRLSREDAWPSGWRSSATSEICFGPVNDVDEMLADPQLRHRGMVVETSANGPADARQPRASCPTRRRHCARRRRSSASTPTTVLRELGFDAAGIERLRADGVIG